MKNEIFTYHDNPITFQNGDSVMINATEMAKPFGKRPVNWLALPSTGSFLRSLEKVRKSDHLIETQSGRIGGTWMHEDVAIEFARWLSPEFAIWCNDRIKELMRHGMTATPDTLEALINDPELVIGLATKLKEERVKLEIADEKIEILTPGYNFAKQFLDSDGVYSFAHAAQILGLGRNIMLRDLREMKVLKRDNSPYQRYAEWFKVVGSSDNRFPTITRVKPRGLGHLAKKLEILLLEGMY